MTAPPVRTRTSFTACASDHLSMSVLCSCNSLFTAPDCDEREEHVVLSFFFRTMTCCAKLLAQIQVFRLENSADKK
jgi:hypothetical protein